MNNLREAMARVDSGISDALSNDPNMPPKLVGLNPDQVRETFQKAAKQAEDICSQLDAEIKRLTIELTRTRAVHDAHMASLKSIDSFGKVPTAGEPMPKKGFDLIEDINSSTIKTKHTGINHEDD